MKKSIFLFVLLLAGCASGYKNTQYMTEKNYEQKEVINTSLLDGENFSEANIQKILSGRISLPKLLNVAVLKVADSNGGLEFNVLEQETATVFYEKAKWGERVRTLIPMPQIMIPAPITLQKLRTSAVLLQADILIVIKPTNFKNWKFKFFENNRAKAVTTLEVLALDTRTGIIPFTSIITEQAEIEKSNDFDDYELMKRAEMLSERKALIQVVAQIKEFFSNVPTN